MYLSVNSSYDDNMHPELPTSVKSNSTNVSNIFLPPDIPLRRLATNHLL